MKNSFYSSNSVDFRNLKINGIEVSEVRWYSKEEMETFHTVKPEKGKKYIYVAWGTSCTWFQISSDVKLTENIKGRKSLSSHLLQELHNNKTGIS